MLDTKSQNSNMLLAFLTLTGVIAIVALVYEYTTWQKYTLNFKPQKKLQKND